MVRGDLPKLVRNIIGALITIDVHARDVVTQMVENKVKGGGGGEGERDAKLREAMAKFFIIYFKWLWSITCN